MQRMSLHLDILTAGKQDNRVGRSFRFTDNGHSPVFTVLLTQARVTSLLDACRFSAGVSVNFTCFLNCPSHSALIKPCSQRCQNCGIEMWKSECRSGLLRARCESLGTVTNIRLPVSASTEVCGGGLVPVSTSHHRFVWADKQCKQRRE